MERRFQKLLDTLLTEIRAYNPYIDTDEVTRAFTFGYDAHKGQKRLSGRPYFEHCYETARLMVELHLDQVTIVAALLHDVVEDTGVTIEELGSRFGADVTALVNGMTKIKELRFEKHEIQQVENFRKMLLSMVDDIRVILIKFGDRLHNMRTLKYQSPEKQIRMATETLDVYAPLAHRLGISQIRYELEDLSFKYLQPDDYRELEKNVRAKRLSRSRFLGQMKRPLLKELAKADITATIDGRAKSLYSIWRKMQVRKVLFEDIHDLFAIRIIVDKVEDCYFALGIVHTLFTPNHDHFKDFIATPKSNNYQSIHTKVVGPHGKMVELQIRTWRMHRIAEVGIAAHVRYKEGRSRDDGLDRHLKWLRRLVASQQDTQDPKEFMDNLRVDLFRDEVFVFTPVGDLYNLPLGSSPIDFAFAVHSTIGLHCTGAKVNGRLAPVGSTLRSGDSVEILTDRTQRPQKEWLSYVKTSKARHHIKRYLREETREQSITLGEEMLRERLQNVKVRNLKRRLRYAIDYFGFTSLDALYSALGQGVLSPQTVLSSILPEQESAAPAQKPSFISQSASKEKNTEGGIRIPGASSLLVHFATCCYPLPPDPVIGYLIKGKGVTVHRSDCSFIRTDQGEVDRMITVNWQSSSKRLYAGAVTLVARDRKHFVRDMTSVISESDANIRKLELKSEHGMVQGFLCLDVQSLAVLDQIISNLRAVSDMVEVGRYQEDAAE